MSEIIPSRLRASVSELLRGLGELEVVVREERYDDGFAFMRVEIHKVMVGFVRDRDEPDDEWEMQIASRIDEWFGLRVWQALLDNAPIRRKPVLCFEDQAAFLLENFPRIRAVQQVYSTPFQLRDLEPDIHGWPKKKSCGWLTRPTRVARFYSLWLQTRRNPQ